MQRSQGGAAEREEEAALEPDREEVQDRLAQAYLQKGDLAEARRRYEMQVRVFPASPNPCLQLARIARSEGKQEAGGRRISRFHARAGASGPV